VAKPRTGCKALKKYGVIQEKRSEFWKAKVSAIVRKNFI